MQHEKGQQMAKSDQPGLWHTSHGVTVQQGSLQCVWRHLAHMKLKDYNQT
jgi:hypothetical protein